MSSLTLEQRLQRLEAIQAIVQLKSRYLFCCDRKDPEGVLECFAPGEVMIDYGRIGVFSHRDQLVEVFKNLGCVEHVLDMHHAANPQIELLDLQHAQGTWALHYVTINTCDKQLIELGAYYYDQYVLIDDQWKIKSSRVVVDSTRIVDLSSDTPKLVFSGREASAAVAEPHRHA